MKKGLVVFMNLALICMLSIPAFSQTQTRSVETVVLDNFDTPDKMDWTWKVQASRFVAEGYPKMGFFDGIPSPLAPMHKSDKKPQVLGVKTAFDRKGDNWFEIYPTKDGKSYEIPMAGNVSQIDYWVWGADYKYFIEVLVRDAEGSVHVLPATSLLFHGWRNVIISIPGNIRQKSRQRSGPKSLSFVGFRVRSGASEYVDDFEIFLDRLEYTTNALPFIYDGYDLNSVNFGDSAQGSAPANTSNSSTSTNSEGAK